MAQRATPQLFLIIGEAGQLGEQLYNTTRQ